MFLLIVFDFCSFNLLREKVQAETEQQLSSSMPCACSEKCVSLLLGYSPEKKSLSQELSNQATRAVTSGFQQKETTTGRENRIHLENVQYKKSVVRAAIGKVPFMIRLFSTQQSQVHRTSVTLPEEEITLGKPSEPRDAQGFHVVLADLILHSLLLTAWPVGFL